MTTDNDDEPLVLSSHALDALKEFYADRDASAQRFARLQEAAERRHDDDAGAGVGAAGPLPLSMEAFTEDWNESQFWYSDETANLLAKQLLDGATADSTIAVVSAPSVFVALKNLVAAIPEVSRPRMILLEHDNRFGVFPEFVLYDFNQPIKLPAELKGAVDRIICDPPFLSEDCQTKAALTVRWLAKANSINSDNTSSAATAAALRESSGNRRLIVCTGERMEPLITGKLYRALGVRTTTYEPAHAKGLSNEFLCYADFECGEWKWK